MKEPSSEQDGVQEKTEPFGNIAFPGKGEKICDRGAELIAVSFSRKT